MSRRSRSHSGQAEQGREVIARNKKARFEFEVLETFEAGIALVGSEVKSLRNRDVSINEAFARPRNGEIWLLGMNIKPYAQASLGRHEPLRPRKLLLHKREIARIIGKVAERGLTLVPLKLYWKRGLAKVQIGLARGRRRYDKRQVIKRREAEREIRRAERGGRR